MAQQDYRKTLNLPNQEFTIPMKAGLAEQEPRRQALWDEMNLYRQMQEKEAPHGLFILHDGPPYSNANIHLGQAMNKILKDVIARSYALRGYRTPYIHGWDNHGMPIENAVSQRFIQEGKTVDRVTLRQACREHASASVKSQRAQMQRLGVIGDWEHSYMTMDYRFEAGLVRVFGELVQGGFIYRDLRPVLWCPTCRTALAEAEVEYQEKTSDSIYVRFPVVQDPQGLMSGTATPYVLIWTTTPWTIPANLALAVHPDFEYVLVNVPEHEAAYLMVDSLVETTMEAIGVGEYQVGGKIKGRDLEGVVAQHPVFERESPIVMADYVLLDEGTGVVHTAPGHGAEDFYTGKQYGLPILCPVDEGGVFTEEAGEFAGLPITPGGNRRVIERLSEMGHLLAHTVYEHNYPHCWRCDTPLIFRATIQWFMNIDHGGHRERCLEQIRKVRWFPTGSENRITAMVQHRPDWCLSRQRAWGVGIPAFFCEACGEALLTQESMEAVAQVIEREGSDAWFVKSAEEILPENTRCGACSASQFRKETDVLDVWFDSGSTHRLVLEKNPELRWPADLYLEGSDQHRGWFNSSLMVGVATKGAAPYRAVITHGFVLDGEGRKMSKSGDNAIDPLQVMATSGADVLRLWVASIEYFEDMRSSDEILKHVSEAYRQIRNTLRFMLGNLADFDSGMAVPYEQMPELDRWALARLQEIVQQSLHAYEIFEFHRFYHLLRHYCNVDLSAFYLDVLKDRLYASAATDPARRSAQTVLLEISSVLCRLLAPVLVHTAEEVWERLPILNKRASVHLEEFPIVQSNRLDQALLDHWAQLMDVREVVNRAVETAKNEKRIPNPLSALVRLKVSGEWLAQLQSYGQELARLWSVSQAEVSAGDSDELEVEVLPAPGQKCARCWLVLPEVGSFAEHPELCARCVDVLQENG
jgi:isoleucyl-tRNA synthetase